MQTTLERAKSNTTRRHDPSTRNLASIPYFPSNACSMKKSLARFDISTSFHSSANLKSLLSHTKSSWPPSSLKNVIYKIPCGDCPDYYIGQTCIPLIKRIKEHEACMRLDNHTDNSTGNIKSAPAKHRRDNGHCIDWKSTTILATCENKSQLNLMEQPLRLLCLPWTFYTKARQLIPVGIPFSRRSLTAFVIFLLTSILRPRSGFLCDLIFSFNNCL